MSQSRIDIFDMGVLLQSYTVDQALCDYEHILDNLHALNTLLEAAVQSSVLKPVTTATFLLDSWDYNEFMDKLAPQQTKRTVDTLNEIHTKFANKGDVDRGGKLPSGIEILITESLHGVWYQKGNP